MQPSFAYITYSEQNFSVHKLNPYLNVNMVDIFSDRYSSIKRVLPLIREWKSQEVTFNVFDRNIVQEISHIRFTQLSVLNLKDNRMESIEGIHRVYMPVLQRLWIGHNCLTTIKDLGKSYFLLLTDVYLAENYICEEKGVLTRIPFKQAMMIRVEYGYNREQLYDPSWLIKMDCLSLHTLRMYSAKRMKRDFFQHKVKQRHPKVCGFR